MHILHSKFHIIYIISIGTCVGLFVGMISLFILPIPTTHAQTRLQRQTISTDTVWSISHSPYILEGEVTISKGATLTINPGVVITTDSVADPLPDIFIEGTLDINGTQEKPVTIENIFGVTLIHGATTTMSHVNMSTQYGLNLSNSYANISYSSFKDAWQAIHIESGIVNIASSSIQGIDFGIFSGVARPVLMIGVMPYATGGIGNALDLPPAQIAITNSSFPSTSSVAINNSDNDPDAMINAHQNWWGSPSGPMALIPSRVEGNVDYAPWLQQEPDLTENVSTTSKCCSSIIFIPGLEGTRLYKNQKGILGFGTSTNTLWEPNRNDDVRALFLNPDGSSVNKKIFSGDPIDSAWTVSIYGSFMKFLDGLVGQGGIGEWIPFGYDWREPISQVVLGDEKKATTSISLIDIVEKMAEKSKTGKVSIVAHSNGGLVAKYLVKTLADQGKSSLIDSVISVAVPYLGTPEAVGSILHGDDASLAGGLLLNTDVARQLGENMSSAYSLLPSQKYFSNTHSSVVDFSSTTPVTINDGSYTKTISNFSALSSFISDSNNIRTITSVSDTANPIKGNSSLLASADDLHSVLDNFSWPENIKNWAILGWNALTTKAITYSGKLKCTVNQAQFGKVCTSVPVHEQIKSNMGDGTVIAQSASNDADYVSSIDLHQVDKGNKTHINILESNTTQSAIKDIVTNESATDNNLDNGVQAKLDAISKIPGVTIGEPDYSKESTYIVVSTHSPIQPHIYDSIGNHTGEIDPPAGTEPGLYKAFENNIPGSSFDSIGSSDGTYDTYIYIPDDGKKYDVELNGTGLGEFEFDIDREKGGVTLNHSEYAELPVTPLTIATATIQLTPLDLTNNNSSTSNEILFQSQLQPLSIDIYGDGNNVLKVAHDATSTLNFESYFEMLKVSCNTIDENSSFCKKVSNRVDKILDLYRKGKLKKFENKSDKLVQFLKHRNFKKLNDSERTDLKNMIDTFISQFE